MIRAVQYDLIDRRELSELHKDIKSDKCTTLAEIPMVNYVICCIVKHIGYLESGSGHETVAVLLPGFAINW